MPRSINRLPARVLDQDLRPDPDKDTRACNDGGGLVLRAHKDGRRWWQFRFTLHGREREMSFGAAGDVTLARARELRAEARAMVAAGRDPIEEREREKRAAAAAANATLGQVADDYVRQIVCKRLRDSKTRAQWATTFANPHYFGKLRAVPVSSIDLATLVAAAEPIFERTPDQGKRMLNRMKELLDWAAARGLRSVENPADWRGPIKTLLGHHMPRDGEEKHHRAPPIASLPAFMARLKSTPGMSAIALRFLTLTAVRTREVLHARWGEIDFSSRTWTMNAGDLRNKTNTLHRVALSDAAIAILREMWEARRSDYIFPAEDGGPLNDRALYSAGESVGLIAEGTPHGLRATFGIAFGVESEVLVERALGHVEPSKTKRAYLRSDALDERRPIMERWASMIDPTRAPPAAASEATGQERTPAAANVITFPRRIGGDAAALDDEPMLIPSPEVMLRATTPNAKALSAYMAAVQNGDHARLPEGMTDEDIREAAEGLMALVAAMQPAKLAKIRQGIIAGEARMANNRIPRRPVRPRAGRKAPPSA